MSRLNAICAQSTWGDLIEGQPQQVAIMFLMSLGAVSLLKTAPQAPQTLGLTSYQWAVVSVLMAGLHQMTVAIVFRLQLHRNWLSNLFGERDMRIWAMIFMPLLAARPVTVVLTGWSDTTGLVRNDVKPQTGPSPARRSTFAGRAAPD